MFHTPTSDNWSCVDVIASQVVHIVATEAVDWNTERTKVKSNNMEKEN